jgi:hypothetical protein
VKYKIYLNLKVDGLFGIFSNKIDKYIIVIFLLYKMKILLSLDIIRYCLSYNPIFTEKWFIEQFLQDNNFPYWYYSIEEENNLWEYGIAVENNNPLLYIHRFNLAREKIEKYLSKMYESKLLLQK